MCINIRLIYLLQLVGYCRSGTLQNNHYSILPWSNGHSSGIRCHGWTVLQQFVMHYYYPRFPPKPHTHNSSDIRTWHSNIEQHASEGVNKILIGNKSDWTDKRAVTEEQGRELADELSIRFMETSAKVNEGVEEAFFTLARCVVPDSFELLIHTDLGILRLVSLILKPMPRVRRLVFQLTVPFVLTSPPTKQCQAVAHRNEIPSCLVSTPIWHTLITIRRPVCCTPWPLGVLYCSVKMHLCLTFRGPQGLCKSWCLLTRTLTSFVGFWNSLWTSHGHDFVCLEAKVVPSVISGDWKRQGPSQGFNDCVSSIIEM